MKVWENFKGNAPRVCVACICVGLSVGDGEVCTVEMGAN